jgi:hypothetical protein
VFKIACQRARYFPRIENLTAIGRFLGTQESCLIPIRISGFSKNLCPVRALTSIRRYPLTTTELQRDLDSALDDAELLARNQIAGAFTYLSQGQRFSISEIKALVSELLAEMSHCECSTPPVAMTAETRWVN